MWLPPDPYNQPVKPRRFFEVKLSMCFQSEKRPSVCSTLPKRDRNFFKRVVMPLPGYGWLLRRATLWHCLFFATRVLSENQCNVRPQHEAFNVTCWSHQGFVIATREGTFIRPQYCFETDMNWPVLTFPMWQGQNEPTQVWCSGDPTAWKDTPVPCDDTEPFCRGQATPAMTCPHHGDNRLVKTAQVQTIPYQAAQETRADPGFRWGRTQRSFDPWAQNLLKIGGFPCLKTSWFWENLGGKGGPDPLDLPVEDVCWWCIVRDI